MRSDRAEDYQDVPRAVAVMVKRFAAGATTGRHNHARAQLLYATDGLMVANTGEGTWIVPSGHAVWIPPGLPHDIAMFGPVTMCTAYVAVDEAAALIPSLSCRVVRASRLLDAVLTALAAEHILYDENGRGGYLAALVLDEVCRAPETPLILPLPRDPRLRRICDILVESPSARLDLDAWAERAGASRRTLTRGFRAQTGLSFGAWRARTCIVRALAMKAEGRGAQEIATAVGYANPQALRAMMRRVLGAGLEALDPQ